MPLTAPVLVAETAGIAGPTTRHDGAYILTVRVCAASGDPPPAGIHPLIVNVCVVESMPVA